MSTPEERLCDRKWRLRNSAWMLWGILSVGMLAFIGWAYVGIRTRRRAWILIAAGLLIFTVAYAAIVTPLALPGKGESGTPEQRSIQSTIGGVILVVWLGSTAAGWVANRKWLVWRANAQSADPWYATATAGRADPVASQSSVGETINRAVGEAIAPTVAASQSPGSRPMVELNSATRDELMQLPAVDGSTADKILVARGRSGGFSSPTDLVTLAGIPPHIFAPMQEYIAVEKSAPTEPIADGRRLEF